MINFKLSFFLLIFLVLFLIYSFTEANVLNYLDDNFSEIKAYTLSDPKYSRLYFFILYFIMATFALPVALILGLISGMLFPLGDAIVIVSFASSFGALGSFYISRYFLKDFFQQRYSKDYILINEGFVRNGASYLFALRMCMLFPYFLINVVSGLTSIRPLIYYFVTQVGMLPATIVVIMLGKNLEIFRTDNVFSIDTEIIVLLTLVGLIPLASKFLLRKYL